MAALGLGALLTLGCGAPDRDAPAAASPPVATSVVADVDSGFARVADSVWIDVRGPTIIAFHPVVSNDSLARDEGLASALDDLAFHLGIAMDSLEATGVAVRYLGGDTIWARAGARRARFVRAADSADVGYVFADTSLGFAPVYGVRGSSDLLLLAREFLRTGTVTAPPR